MGLRRRADGDAPRVVGFDFDRLAAGAPPAPAAPPPAWTDENPFAPEPSYEAPAPALEYAVTAPAFAPPAYTPYTPTPTPPPPPGYLPPTTHWQQPAPPGWDLPTPSRVGPSRALLVRIAGMVVVALLVGSRAYRALDGLLFGKLSTPSTLAGATLVDDGPIVEDMRDSLPRLGPWDDVVLALYEEDGVPSYVLIAAENDGVDVEQMHRWFSQGAKTQNASVSELVKVGDVSCANVGILQMQVAVCFWAGHDTAGYLMDITGGTVDDTASVTRIARAGVEK